MIIQEAKVSLLKIFGEWTVKNNENEDSPQNIHCLLTISHLKVLLKKEFKDDDWPLNINYKCTRQKKNKDDYTSFLNFVTQNTISTQGKLLKERKWNIVEKNINDKEISTNNIIYHD